MQTQHNVFIRKFGEMAIVITVTDWNDFKDLEKHSQHESPDFLLGGITSTNIYTNMNPSILLSTKGEVKDITNETRGLGIDGIMTNKCIWGFRKINGLSATTEMITPKMD